ncbi:MAG: Hpt domain-containing protein [Ferruginibacter sp.]|nr:Hpt domain-containing protein [Ferruginibacter sp.]
MIIMEQRLFDLSLLEQIDDKGFIAEILVIYLQDTHRELEQMKRASDTGDTGTIYKTAHKLKGSTGMLQANKLCAILNQIEKIAKDGSETCQLHKLVLTALNEFAQLKTALELHLQKMLTAAPAI